MGWGWRHLSLFKFLLEKNELIVSDTGYLVFANAKKDFETFNGSLPLQLKIFSKKLDIDWIEDTINDINNILKQNSFPLSSKICKYCKFIEHVMKI